MKSQTYPKVEVICTPKMEYYLVVETREAEEKPERFCMLRGRVETERRIKISFVLLKK